MVLACVNSTGSIDRQESSRLLPVFYASIAKPGLRVCHLPRVKSGPSTGALPQAIDTSGAGNRVVGGSSGGRLAPPAEAIAPPAATGPHEDRGRTVFPVFTALTLANAEMTG